MHRVFHSGPLSCGQPIQLSDFAAQHIGRALRLVVGDSLIVFNGDGGQYLATITDIVKQKIWVMPHEQQIVNHESPLHTTLAQVISRGDKMDTSIQKAVELGVNCIVPLFSERCGVKLSDERLQKRMLHWQRTVISACEQCGRNSLPELLMAQRLNTWLPSAPDSLKLVLNPHQAKQTMPTETPTAITLLIGPEGGLSQTELKLAEQAGFASWQLGPRVLRTETAALVALSQFQTLWGDLI